MRIHLRRNYEIENESIYFKKNLLDSIHSSFHLHVCRLQYVYELCFELITDLHFKIQFDSGRFPIVSVVSLLLNKLSQIAHIFFIVISYYLCTASDYLCYLRHFFVFCFSLRMRNKYWTNKRGSFGRQLSRRAHYFSLCRHISIIFLIDLFTRLKSACLKRCPIIIYLLSFFSLFYI